MLVAMGQINSPEICSPSEAQTFSALPSNQNIVNILTCAFVLTNRISAARRFSPLVVIMVMFAYLSIVVLTLFVELEPCFGQKRQPNVSD